jgi:UDP-glucose 4-epimerase
VLARVDAVMHFAAHAYVGESVENPRKDFRNNVVAALRLLNCTMHAGIRHFVFSSTCVVYGTPQANANHREDAAAVRSIPIAHRSFFSKTRSRLTAALTDYAR